jgi:hypothetical protein
MEPIEVRLDDTQLYRVTPSRTNVEVKRMVRERWVDFPNTLEEKERLVVFKPDVPSLSSAMLKVSDNATPATLAYLAREWGYKNPWEALMEAQRLIGVLMDSDAVAESDIKAELELIAAVLDEPLAVAKG